MYVEGVTQNKRDGTSVMYPIHPSNLKITKLDLGDELRKAKIESRNGKTQVKAKAVEAKN